MSDKVYRSKGTKDMDKLKNIAIFASGNGSNFQAIVDAVKKKKLKVNIKLLICDNPQAYVLQRAVKAKVKAFIADRRDFLSKKSFEEEVIRKLRLEKIDLIVLAGFMRILSASFVRWYKNKILNIHPSLLPAFKGRHAIKDAFLYGVKITGVTVHFVDEETDHGPILLQEAMKVKENDTLKSLEARIHSVEHTLYPEVIRLILKRRLRIKRRKVEVG